MEFIDAVFDYLRAGFYEVNHVQGLIIALVAVLLLPSIKRIPVFVLGATVVHLVVDVLAPVMAGNRNAQLRLPPIVEVSFWEQVLVLLLGYFIVISVLAVIKRLVLKR